MYLFYGAASGIGIVGIDDSTIVLDGFFKQADFFVIGLSGGKVIGRDPFG